MSDAARTPMRVRFAPSPTGALHVGSMRTALFAWLSARSTGGQFILRIEDTDRDRYIEDSEALIYESLAWLGLDFDEGPEVGGAYGPYVQSMRLALYEESARKLADSGAAYWCTCTPERLEEMRAGQREAHEAPRYDRRCVDRQDEVAKERAGGARAVLRQKMPEGRAEWTDVVRGAVSFDYADIDDSVLLKSDGYPTYHLAVVVDDHFMEITDVIRADEWIPSTPKHIALYEAFGWKIPNFAHVPNVLGPDGKKKLSKRHGARFILEYGELGYLPEAVVNAMALLGWSSPTAEEVLSREQLVALFSLDRVNSAPAVFDPKRLDDLNGIHIRGLNDDDLIEALEFHLPGTSKPTRRELIPMLRDRMVTLRDAADLTKPLLTEISWPEDAEFPPKNVPADVALDLLDETIREVDEGALEDVEKMRERLTAWLEARGVKARDGFRVLYLAILGRSAGVPVFDAMKFIGDVVAVDRLRAARNHIAPAA